MTIIPSCYWCEESFNKVHQLYVAKLEKEAAKLAYKNRKISKTSCMQMTSPTGMTVTNANLSISRDLPPIQSGET